jgi:hypothetical protein
MCLLTEQKFGDPNNIHCKQIRKKASRTVKPITDRRTSLEYIQNISIHNALKVIEEMKTPISLKEIQIRIKNATITCQYLSRS